MPSYVYRIDKRKLTKKEKEERALIYNEWNPDAPINVKDFVQQEIFDETVVFECIDCHYKETFDFDEVKECFIKDDNLIPLCKCPNCKDGVMIPEEIREKY